MYRTKTYIAAEWDGDHDAIEILHQWNESDHWSLSFTDAHLLTQARDSSLNCSIKSSLKERMDASKTFVLIVGNRTDSVTAGSCGYCNSYNAYQGYCVRGRSVDFRGYIKFECAKAVEAGLKIVVLYNSTRVDRNKCPSAVRYEGIHIPMKFYKEGNQYWDYYSIKKALEN